MERENLKLKHKDQMVGGNVNPHARQLWPTPAAARPPTGRHHPWWGVQRTFCLGRLEKPKISGFHFIDVKPFLHILDTFLYC